MGYAISLPVGFHSVSTMNNTPNAIGVAATGYILKRVGGDTIVALYGIASGVLHINRYNNSSSTWLGWLTCVTNTDLENSNFWFQKTVLPWGNYLNGTYTLEEPFTSKPIRIVCGENGRLSGFGQQRK